MTYEDLPCRDFVELATDYLEGALNVEQRLVVELHLATCSPCVDYLDQLRTTLRVIGELRDEDVPEPVMESLVNAFRELKGTGPAS
jgi:predicted anti-sigma-YlaC factor YlaD